MILALLALNSIVLRKLFGFGLSKTDRNITIVYQANCFCFSIITPQEKKIYSLFLLLIYQEIN